jgi:Recombination endonuclease VII
MTRDEARLAGEKHYDAEKPCKHGHEPRRYVSNQQCLVCAKEQESKQYRKDPVAARERRKAWIKRNPEKRRQYERTKRLKDPERVIARTRRAGWKFRNMPAPTRPPPKLCECCGKAETRAQNGRTHGLHLDHCHDSNRFRGWLCSACNLGIGKLGDTIESVERALTYLRRATAEATNGHTGYEDD